MTVEEIHDAFAHRQGRGAVDSLVLPVPDESALQVLVFLYRVPVVAQTAKTVAHRVAVFNHNIRPDGIVNCEL